MPDIAMCADKGCASHKDCYRYMAVPNEPYQTMQNFHREDDEINCTSFEPIDGRRINTALLQTEASQCP